MHGRAVPAIFLVVVTIAIGIAAPPRAGIAVAQPAAADNQKEYAGQRSRAIKALSESDIAELRNGDGMGLAKAAELNSYPGPRHVLDLASELRLSEAQIKQVTAIRERMSVVARALGAALIERERTLDQLFAEGKITLERLAAETATIGDLQARLRAAHLAAHIETRGILSTEQVAQYNKLRGYDEPATTQPSAPSGHSGGHRH